MSASNNPFPTYGSVIHEILTGANGPMAVEDLAEAVFRMYPNPARNPKKLVYNNILNAEGKQLVYLDRNTVLSMALAMQGARFRLRLGVAFDHHTALSNLYDPLSYLPPDMAPKQLIFMDARDQPIPGGYSTILTGELLGAKNEAFDFKDWIQSQKITGPDHILATILDWEKGILRLEIQRAADVLEDQIRQRNRLIADAMFERLQRGRSGQISSLTALGTAYAGLPDKAGLPPDHWRIIAGEDFRLHPVGGAIGYALEGKSRWDGDLGEPSQEPASTAPAPTPPEIPGQIYRIRAILVKSPTVWREVEVLGKDSLSSLDRILREAFGHDALDHRSGFWKKIPRQGNSKHLLREMEIGEIEPTGPDQGAKARIASIGLQVGDRLKYVYDFGDRIEHDLEITTIDQPEPGVEYPRVAAKSLPKRQYCVLCQEEGVRTVAEYACVDCSIGQERAVVLCEAHVEQHKDIQDTHTIVELQ